MRGKVAAIASFAFVVTLAGCGENKNDISTRQKGYIIFDDQNFWHFVPVASIASENCFDGISASKLKKGFQFDPSAIKNLSFIQRTLDTLIGDTQEPSIKITPVEIEYQFKQRYFELFQSNSSDPNWNFTYKKSVKGKLIKFTYNVFPVSIKEVRPLFCLNKKEKDIKPCACEHKITDKNDFIFKICSHIQKVDPYAFACDYRIKNISTDTLNGKLVTKVELTCCGLGDIAYFDMNTKEIINIEYGGL